VKQHSWVFVLLRFGVDDDDEIDATKSGKLAHVVHPALAPPPATAIIWRGKEKPHTMASARCGYEPRVINSKKANSKKSTAPVEDDGFLRKALFNPGPVTMQSKYLV